MSRGGAHSGRSEGRRGWVAPVLECFGFGAEFFLAFGFKNPGFHGLKEVDAADVTLSDEYWEVMGVCNSENPTIRSEDPMCDFHKTMKDITEPNLIALFHTAAYFR